MTGAKRLGSVRAIGIAQTFSTSPIIVIGFFRRTSFTRVGDITDRSLEAAIGVARTFDTRTLMVGLSAWARFTDIGGIAKRSVGATIGVGHAFDTRLFVQDGPFGATDTEVFFTKGGITTAVVIFDTFFASVGVFIANIVAV